MSNRRNLSSTLSADVIAYVRGLGHSQADIARMLGVSEGFVSLVKSRERGLTLDHLELLSQALSLPLGAMLVAVTDPPKDWKGSPQARKLIDQLADVMRQADKATDAIMRDAGASSR